MKSEKNNIPQRFTPESLSNDFESVIFDVPIYQRLFAWRDEQVLKLMEDLLEAFSIGKQYYLGILTIAVNNGQLDLIDGQQRMTMTTLMAIAFKELNTHKNGYWNKYLANGKRLKFSARDEDTSYLFSRANGEKPDHVNFCMKVAIKLIKDWCIMNVHDISAFAEYVWRNLTLFCSYLPKNYVDNPIELNRYFEAMNSTGRQLKQHEILLVELVSGHPNSVTLSDLWQKIADNSKRIVPNCDGTPEEKDQARQDYKWHLANASEIFGSANTHTDEFATIEDIKPASADNSSAGNGDSSKEMLISFEDLLLMALDITLGKESSRQFYKPEHLLARFEGANLQENGLINAFFVTLYKCRLLLDYKIIWQETGGDFDYDIVTEDKDHRLEKFQSMLYVSHQGEFYRWLPKYIKWLIENPDSDPELELKQLKNIDCELHPSIPLLGNLNYEEVDRYWFWRLDYELWAHRNDVDGWLKDNILLKDVVNRYVFRANRSIEHLLPQTPTDDKSEVWDREDLDRFGNLAMISASFNSLQSNDSAGVKMERIHHQIETSQLQSLKMLHMWMLYRNGETWTVEKAKTHEDAMYAYVERLYANN
jgi:hypothetical protein